MIKLLSSYRVDEETVHAVLSDVERGGVAFAVRFYREQTQFVEGLRIPYIRFEYNGLYCEIRAPFTRYPTTMVGQEVFPKFAVAYSTAQIQ